MLMLFRLSFYQSGTIQNSVYGPMCSSIVLTRLCNWEHNSISSNPFSLTPVESECFISHYFLSSTQQQTLFIMWGEPKVHSTLLFYKKVVSADEEIMCNRRILGALEAGFSLPKKCLLLLLSSAQSLSHLQLHYILLPFWECCHLKW